MPFNLSGHPAVVIPIGQTQNGLPIGMQVVGKRWKEIEMLAIALVPNGSKIIPLR
jgi:amidase